MYYKTHLSCITCNYVCYIIILQQEGIVLQDYKIYPSFITCNYVSYIIILQQVGIVLQVLKDTSIMYKM